ncbi:MAG: hypothetical protein LBH76_08925 [Propionibacteriaceae bacterium]|jgi:hypothetical protein|nr:hypothetical protein [Propionibacteriaceae bacterium]
MPRKNCWDHESGLCQAAAATTSSAADIGSTALDRLTPVLAQAAERVGPLADEAVERAKAAKVKAAGWAADRVEHLQPALNSALDKVPPAVDRAQRTIQSELIPGLVDALHGAAGRSVVPAPPPRRSFFKRLLKVVAVGAALAGVAALVRAYLAGSKEDHWATEGPRQAYVYPDDAQDDAGQANSSDVAAYETDSYIGPNPPAGFTIKANARSKKYHLPGSRNYDRTIAEVWFPTEEAAQAAGFAKAQS